MLRAFGHRVATCCEVLAVVRSNLTIFKLEPTTPNMPQHIATRWPNARNMLRPTMLRYVALACWDHLAGAKFALHHGNKNIIFFKITSFSMCVYIQQYLHCYFTLKQYNKIYIHYLQNNRAINNTTYGTRLLPYCTCGNKISLITIVFPFSIFKKTTYPVINVETFKSRNKRAEAS